MSQFLSRKLIIILIIIILIFGVIGYTAKDGREKTNIELFVKDSLGFFQSISSSTINFFHDLYLVKVNINNAYEENKLLKAKLANYTELEAKVHRLRNENEELLNLLQLEDNSLEVIATANIIWRSADLWQDQLIIDKGSHSGIKKNMAVKVEQGLVGSVISTTKFTATIHLLTNNINKNRVAVEIQNGEGSVYGILKGYDAEKSLLRMQVVSDVEDIKMDSLVVTSGLGNVFPAGIVVGKVKNMVIDEVGLSREFEVESNVDFNRLYSVQVINNKAISLNDTDTRVNKDGEL